MILVVGKIICNVEEKHHEKIDKYLYLSVELQALWNAQTEVVPLVFGALGSIPEQTKENFEFLKLTMFTSCKKSELPLF